MQLSNKGNFIINDTYEFAAAHIEPEFESLTTADSGRTADGEMHINWIFRVVRNYEIEMPPMSDKAQLALLLSLVQGKEYNITVWDILSNSQKTVRVYTSNSEADMYSGYYYNGLWQGIKFKAIGMSGDR